MVKISIYQTKISTKKTFLVPGLKTRSRIAQKQPYKGVLRKKYSENIQQFYRRTPAPKCDFNKVADWNRTTALVFSCKFAAYFQNNFSQKHLWRAVSSDIVLKGINPTQELEDSDKTILHIKTVSNEFEADRLKYYIQQCNGKK